ncbi:ABC transporter permease [Rhizohabitans arisaemae]|uniref:ABC transporter permease n=1 Tax=Rhizohabitans arisaemae TaxID=2720610 RepID=UPI0024B16944|nr:ABC transporter permease [Rhizohabitans arisaemae]
MATPTAAPSRGRYLARRVLRLLVSLWIVLTLSFLMVHLIPGDPARASLGLTAPQELVESRRAELGLDRPLPVQYLTYLGDLARGDLGVSFTSRLPVSRLIGERILATLHLAGLALVVVLIAGVAAGLLATVVAHSGRHRGTDLAFSGGSGVLVAMPEFVTAVGLVAAFGVTLRWLPVAGLAGPDSYLLPVLALASGPAAALARIVRAEGLRVLDLEYIRTARAKRLTRSRLYLRHALPNCLTATLTVAGLTLSSLVAGTVLIENVFAWPGLGSAIVSSITQKDYPLTQGLILVLSGIVLLVNFAVDLLIMAVDPRSALGEV